MLITSQVNCHTVAHDTWPLTAHVVLPQARCLYKWRVVCQTDDKVV